MRLHGVEVLGGTRHRGESPIFGASVERGANLLVLHVEHLEDARRALVRDLLVAGELGVRVEPLARAARRSCGRQFASPIELRRSSHSVTPSRRSSSA